MIEQVNEACLELQKALFFRALYRPGDPAILDQESRATRALSEALGTKASIRLDSSEAGVLFEGRALPDSPSLTDRLFRRLRLAGVGAVTFSSGVTADEVAGFLGALSLDPERRPEPPQDTPHVRFAVDTLDPQPLVRHMYVSTDPADRLASERAIAALDEILSELERGEYEADERLEELVEEVMERAACTTAVPLVGAQHGFDYVLAHSLNVAVLTVALAVEAGYSGTVVREMAIAALVHDAGARTVGEKVWTAEGRLAAEELSEMESHPVRGARLLMATPGLPSLAAVVAFEHHVHYGGGGYPRLPMAWRLNHASRLVQIADVFDALRWERPYRASMPLSQIVSILLSERDRIFDRELVGLFIERVVPRGIPASVSGEAEREAEGPAS